MTCVTTVTLPSSTLVLIPIRLGVLAILIAQVVKARKAKRRIEEALAAVAASEARFHAFMNNGPFVGFIKDDAGRLVYLNRKFSEVFRRSPAEVLGKTAFELISPDQATEIDRHDRELLYSGQPGEETQPVKGPDGSLSNWLTVKFPFSAGGRKFLGALSFDVSAREKAEEALRESEERFRTAFVSAAVGMAVTDTAGRFMQANPALCQILGYSCEEILSRDVTSITHLEDIPMTLEWHRKAIAASADHLRYQKRCIRKDGASVWVQISLGVVRNPRQEATHFIALIEDITRERRSEERWLLALEATNDGIWDWDVASNSVYYSARWKQMLGFEEWELPNRPEVWEHLVHPDDLSRAKLSVDQHLDRQRPHYEAEYRIRCKDGTYKWVLARGKAIWGEGGKPVRMIGAHADITERKRAEEKLFYQASFDSLTGVMNRGYFLSWLEKKILSARSKGQELSLCICDIDRFKSINDRYGHRAGDDVLVNLARILKESIRTSDLCGRLGGDEFCVLLVADADQAGECLERVRDRFQTIAFGSEGKSGVFSASASFGIAQFSPGMTSASFIEAADRALYAAKQKGRNVISSDHGLAFPLLETRPSL